MGGTIGTCQINRLDFRSSKPWPYEAGKLKGASWSYVHQERWKDICAIRKSQRWRKPTYPRYSRYHMLRSLGEWWIEVNLFCLLEMLIHHTCSQDAAIWWRLWWNHTWPVLSQVTQDNQVVCGIELCVVEEEPAVPCSHERRIVLGIEENWKTVMLSSLTNWLSQLHQCTKTYRNYQRLHRYSSSSFSSCPTPSQKLIKHQE